MSLVFTTVEGTSDARAVASLDAPLRGKPLRLDGLVLGASLLDNLAGEVAWHLLVA
jgi:hypothetical protein